MITIIELRVDMDHKIKSLQDVDRYINKSEFKLFFENQTDMSKQYLQTAAMDGNIYVLKTKYSEWFYKHFGMTGLRHLRELAKQLGILYYTSKSKEQLLKEIHSATVS